MVLILPEFSPRTPGCDERCILLSPRRARILGLTEPILHSPAAHEDHGRLLGARGAPDGHTIVTGALAVNLASYLVSVGGAPVWLPATETRIVLYLARRIGQVCSRKEIAAAVWGNEWVATGYDHVISVNLARLRQRLGPAGPLIVTLTGLGIRLDEIPPGQPTPQPVSSRPRINRWARDWDRCRHCGSDQSGHRAHGYCNRTVCRSFADTERWQAEQERRRASPDSVLSPPRRGQATCQEKEGRSGFGM